MSVARVASTYAKSLLDLAVERNDIDEVLKDMDLLEQSIENRDLYLLLKSPIINKDKKNKILSILFDGKVSKLTSSFMDIIVRKGRENILPEIIAAFDEQYKKFKKITSIVLTTAEEISEENLAEIKKKLIDSSITAETVDIVTKIDPSIIGGFIIEVGDKLYDASAAHQLNKLRKEFSTNDFVKAF